MERFFVTYEIAKQLKEIGFNEGCLACFDRDNKFRLSGDTYWNHNGWDNIDQATGDFNNEGELVSAPLYDQVIDWFIKQGLFISCNIAYPLSFIWYINPTNGKFSRQTIGGNNCYDGEEGYYLALNAGILKAIELIKQKI